jgi:hypothetical protein
MIDASGSRTRGAFRCSSSRPAGCRRIRAWWLPSASIVISAFTIPRSGQRLITNGLFACCHPTTPAFPTIRNELCRCWLEALVVRHLLRALGPMQWMGRLGQAVHWPSRHSYECPSRCERCFNSERFRKPTKQRLLEIRKCEPQLRRHPGGCVARPPSNIPSTISGRRPPHFLRCINVVPLL